LSIGKTRSATARECNEVKLPRTRGFIRDIAIAGGFIAIGILAALRARVGELERERDELRDALKKMTAHFGLDEDEMKEQEYFLNKKAVIAIRAANAALAKGAK